jgi:hypothetical protein
MRPYLQEEERLALCNLLALARKEEESHFHCLARTLHIAAVVTKVEDLGQRLAKHKHQGKLADCCVLGSDATE